MSCNIPMSKVPKQERRSESSCLIWHWSTSFCLLYYNHCIKARFYTISSIHYEPNAYYIFDRAYDSFKELYRIHLTDSFFVVRTKTNLKYKTVKWRRRLPKNIMTDAEVKLTGYLSEKKYPDSFRLFRYYDEEDDREFTFLTNTKQVSALDVANLYKKRWLIELFFKWLKQHLKIKKF